MMPASSILFQGPHPSPAQGRWLAHLKATQQTAQHAVLVLTPDADARDALIDHCKEHHIALAPEAIHSWPSYLWGMLQRAWPQWAPRHGFAGDRPPTYLAFEQAQMVMDAVAEPLRAAGHFDGWALAPARLAAELLDVRSHAASAALRSTQVPDHLPPDSPAPDALQAFATRCQRFNLIDYATLARYADACPAPNAMVFAYRLDEWPPVALQMLSRWMGEGVTCIGTTDPHGGTRFRLGVDARYTTAWRDVFPEVAALPPATTSAPLHLAASLSRHLAAPDRADHEAALAGQATQALWGHLTDRKRPRLFRTLAGTIRSLLNQGTAPSEIALIAPYIDGATEVLLTDAFARAQIPLVFARRQQRLTAAPDVRAVQGLCALLTPDTLAPPHPDDVALTLHRVLPDVDPMRARLLADLLFEADTGVLRETTTLREKDRVRFTAPQREAYDALLNRLHPLDQPTVTELLAHATSFLPDEILDSASVCSLLDAAKRFIDLADALDVPAPYRRHRFFAALDAGFLAPTRLPDSSAALVVYAVDGFLRTDRTVAVQCWLDVDAPGWMPTPYAAFMNRATLSAAWPSDATWSTDDERQWRQDQATRRLRSLLDRCTHGLYLCSHRDPQAALTPTPLVEALTALWEAKP